MKASTEFVLITIWIPFSMALLPEDQPGCLFRPAMSHFFAYHANLESGSKNWLCEETTFEDKLKICIDVYEKTTKGKVKSSYQIVKDKENVITECQKRNITFEQIFEEGESEYVANDTIRNTTIQVTMFACPIRKMDLKFPVKYLKPPIYDIYISLGRNDVTISVLTNSVKVNNICVRDTYLYPPPHLRTVSSARPFYTDEIRMYEEMNDPTYFEALASRIISRKMATATDGEIYTLDTDLPKRTKSTVSETAFQDVTVESTTQEMSSHTTGEMSTQITTVETTRPVTSQTTLQDTASAVSKTTILEISRATTAKKVSKDAASEKVTKKAVSVRETSKEATSKTSTTQKSITKKANEAQGKTSTKTTVAALE